MALQLSTTASRSRFRPLPDGPRPRRTTPRPVVVPGWSGEGETTRASETSLLPVVTTTGRVALDGPVRLDGATPGDTRTPRPLSDPDKTMVGG